MLSVEKPAGGMQLIDGLSDGLRDTAIVTELAARGIQARAISSFYLGAAPSQGLLLGFAGYTSEVIEAGFEEIKGVFPS